MTADLHGGADTAVRVRLSVAGTVQGVGFRPFVRRVATELALGGWVINTADGAVLEVEGPIALVERFQARVIHEAPTAAQVRAVTAERVPALGEGSFCIRQSARPGRKRVVVPPDLATCERCRLELADPHDRRSRYPFLTCTQCGPRYSILTGLPYDRPNTTMSGFALCAACQAEYDDEADRRFHAEPIACPICGPHVALWDPRGVALGAGESALRQACALVREGRVLAVKGLGGFQLWVDAASEQAVQRLRERKRRPHKPFAVLFPSLAGVGACCTVSPEEEALLLSPQAPIVLLRRQAQADLAEAVGPDAPLVGAMLPYTPLHALLMAELNRPVVATSGNRADEPIVTDEGEALTRLNGIADAFLVHNRPIVRPIDDSVVRVVDTHPLVLRRARGYVPLPIVIADTARDGRPLPAVLAVGGHLKSTVAMALRDQIMLSQHLGDLSTSEAFAAFRRAIEDLQHLLELRPELVACDLHPDYRSSLAARDLASALGVPLVRVQHHHAHVAACMAEHGLSGEVLGVAWDGAGYGSDGTLWGGEFLAASYGGFRRLATLWPFRLPGGEQAMREPRRSALALLWETFGEGCLTCDLPALHSFGDSLAPMASLLRRAISAPSTTSMGRLFDAVASLVNLCQVASFEGQAALALEALAEGGRPAKGFPIKEEKSHYAVPLHPALEPSPSAEWIADWRPVVNGIVRDLQCGTPPERIAYEFHAALADLVLAVAERAALPRVVLTGGVFQNALLTRLARGRLERAGFVVYTHRQVPPNDGGLSLGQAIVAAHSFALAKGPEPSSNHQIIKSSNHQF